MLAFELWPAGTKAETEGFILYFLSVFAIRALISGSGTGLKAEAVTLRAL